MSDELELALQFLVCPQRDFIRRLDDAEERPNALHVGREAAGKLRGDPRRGEPDPFVETALCCFDPRRPGSARTHVVIDEDWHPRNCREFPIFGEHCVKGTEGARLAGDLEPMRWSDRTHIIRANSINIASDPQYGETLRTLVGRTRPDRIRVGVYGVWTNVKVEYLLVNLRTCWPQFEQIAVCEPLCAAPDPVWHQQAIAKFEMMGFTIFRDIPSYLDWLGLGS